MKDGREKKISITDITELGVMIAALEVGKMALNGVPNVEIVTFLLILFTVYFGKKTLLAVTSFIALECFVFPAGLWVFMYIYIWPILVLLVLVLRKKGSYFLWCIVAGLYGLCFGAMGSLVYVVTSGPAAAFAWWIAGIPFDIVHGVANFVIMLVLYPPMSRVFAAYCKKKTVRDERIRDK